MGTERMAWMPNRVFALQEAYRAHNPLLTHEQFAQDILNVAPRSLYLWKVRPGTSLRPGTQRALDAALRNAPPAVVARFHDLVAGRPPDPARSRDSQIATTYSFGLSDTLRLLGEISRQSATGIQYLPDNLAATVLDWIASPRRTSLSLTIDDQDVDHIRETTRALDAIERTIGGPGCRSTATNFLRDVALPMLNAHHETAVHSDLFSAVAELCELIGWMAYDAGDLGLAQASFTHALRLAREAGDDALAAFLMTSLSHQALFAGHARHALRLASAASQVAGSANQAQVVAEGELLSARALAQLGEKREGVAALARAEHAFDRQADAPDRSWLAQWDETIFSSHSATVWLTLGKATEARRLMQRVWDTSLRHPRRRIYAGAELGIASLHTGDLDEAVTMAESLLPTLSASDSWRSRHHYKRLVSEIARRSTPQMVKHLLSEMQ